MSDNMRGALAMVAAQLCFIVNDAAMKWIAQDQGMPMGEAVFLRGILATSVLLALVTWRGQLGQLKLLASSHGAARTIAEIVASLAYLYAVVGMPIADLVGLLQVVPLAITAGAALFLGEPVGWRRWTATLAGFAGALIIVRPGASPLSVFVLLGLLAITAIIARDLLTRSLPAGVAAPVISLTSAVAVMLGGLLFAGVETWIAPPPGMLATVAFAAVFLVGANTWQVAALRTGEIAVVGPFRYTVLLWAVLAGFAVWGELPDRWTLAGMAVVTAAGLYTLFREQRLGSGVTARVGIP